MNVHLTAGEIMQVQVHCVPPEMPLPELDRQFSDRGAGGFPVVEDGRLVGVVSRADIVRQLVVERQLAQTTSDFYWDNDGFHEEPLESVQQVANRVGQRIEGLRVKDVMSTHIVAVAVDDAVDVVARRFLEHHIHRVMVVDQGRLVGIITSLDLVRLVAEHRVQPVP